MKARNSGKVRRFGPGDQGSNAPFSLFLPQFLSFFLWAALYFSYHQFCGRIFFFHHMQMKATYFFISYLAQHPHFLRKKVTHLIFFKISNILWFEHHIKSVTISIFILWRFQRFVMETKPKLEPIWAFYKSVTKIHKSS